MATAPNAALPAGPAYRMKPACDSAEPTGQAAGTLVVAPDGSILLLRRSSSEENFPGHWALPGGNVDPGETAEQAAAREMREEIGRDVDSPRKLLNQVRTPKGKVFHTFAQPVAEKFAPTLNSEHSGYDWASLNSLPQPMHPAIVDTFRDRLGVGADMKPEDWHGLRDGFLKWLSEEEAEPEHAADSKLPHAEVDYGPTKGRDRCDRCAHFQKDGPHCEIVADPIEAGGWCKRFAAAQQAADSAFVLAMDRDSVRSYRKDGQLVVERSHITKANVCPYRGSEIPGWNKDTGTHALGLDPNKIYMLLRDPEELRKAAPTLNGVQLLIKHVPVSAEDPQQNKTVGSLGTDAEFVEDGGENYLDNSLFVNVQEAIDGIESGKRRELSAGYHYKPVMTPGMFHGRAYDGVMTDIVFNHVALVEDGRAGPDIMVGDSAENIRMTKPTRLAAFTLGMTAAAVSPLLAMDAKIELPKKLFAELTSKNFKEKRAALFSAVKLAMDGKLKKGLALDASSEHVKTVLDALENLTEGVDESATEAQHNAMEAAAHGESKIGIPKSVGEEFSQADKGKTFDSAPIAEFLRGKGMGEDDLKTVMDMLPKSALAGDEEDEEAKKKAEEERKKKEAMGNDNVSKQAMDAALRAQGEDFEKRLAAVRENERGVRAALDMVKPWVGDIPATMAFDTGAAVIRHALEMRGFAGAKTVHDDALRPILESLPKPGAKAPDAKRDPIAMDSTMIGKAQKIAPGLAHISTSV